MLQLYKDLRKKHRDLIPGFNLIQEIVEYLGSWQGRVLPYDAGADQIYRGFSTRIQQELGDDARIAAIALARRSGMDVQLKGLQEGPKPPCRSSRHRYPSPMISMSNT